MERWYAPCVAETEFLNLILIYFRPTIYCIYFIHTEFSFLNMGKDTGKAISVQTHRPR
jgi:hypothetical protein